MNELSNYNQQLPETLEDLSKFVLINEERIQALRAEIRAIKKVSLAKEVYEQKLAEAQEIGQVTVEAAQKMGELLLQIQKQSGNQYTNASSSNIEKAKTKTEITSEMGMSKDQVSQYQQMAQNPEAVQAAIQKAIENGDVVSRSQVMKEIRSIKEQLLEKERKISELENREPQIKEVIREKQVVPPDYEEWKRKAQIAQNDFRSMQKAYEEMAEKWKTSEREKASIKEAWTKEKNDPQAQMKQSALFFCAGIANFIERYGGYIWLTEHINELPETEKKGFLSGINALDAWVRQIKNNMGEYANE